MGTKTSPKYTEQIGDVRAWPLLGGLPPEREHTSKKTARVLGHEGLHYATGPHTLLTEPLLRQLADTILPTSPVTSSTLLEQSKDLSELQNEVAQLREEVSELSALKRELEEVKRAIASWSDLQRSAPTRLERDASWFRTNHERLQEQYTDKTVAIFDGKVVASGPDLRTVRELARMFPKALFTTIPPRRRYFRV